MTKLTIEPGSGNVYADLGMADAHEMLVKANECYYVEFTSPMCIRSQSGAIY